jgi:hypothetical protein
MRARRLAPLLALILAAQPARAGVVVVANYTTEPVAFTVAEPKAKPRAHTLASNHVAPVDVAGPADLAFKAKGRDFTYRIDAYGGYVFLADKDAGVRLEGIELPGQPLERDGRPEVNPVPRDPPVKVPVTLLVDDADPRAGQLWRKELRARFDEVAGVVEKSCGIRLEVAGFATWKSDAEAKNLTDLLAGFEAGVKVKPGALAVGYTSRKIDEKDDPAFGICRGLGARHVLLREWRPKNEPERAEALLHFVGQALGAVGTPDPGSAMREKLADGYILARGAVLRLDPLNALALNLWADERRRDPDIEIATLSAANRHRLTRVYKALLKANPGDALALAYLESLDRDVARNPEPQAEPKKPERRPPEPGKRDELVRQVVQAVAARAAENSAAASPLTGDELTAAYVRAAAEAALKQPGPEAVSAFLVGTGVALDDTDSLLSHPDTVTAAKGAETPDERKARLAALGNPTLAGRRDLCRRFFVGCAAGELLPQHAAEKLAVGRVAADLQSPGGLCLPALAAEFAGISFARAAAGDPEQVRKMGEKLRASDHLPSMDGLRGGLSADKFAELYGSADDDRFAAVLADIRKRLKGRRTFE